MFVMKGNHLEKIPITKLKVNKKGENAEEINRITLLEDKDTETSYLCISASLLINKKKSYSLKNC